MTDVRVEEAGPGIVLVTLDGPDRRNALSLSSLDALERALRGAADDRSCRAIVLTGTPPAFCAGLDLKGTADVAGAIATGEQGPGRSLRQQARFGAVVPMLRELPVPLIAAVDGAASGAGFALALGCDVRIASEQARFNVANIRIGLSGGDLGMSWLLPRLVGASRAFELLLTGRFVDAAEADRIGLVTRVVPDGGVVEAALETAAAIAANSPFGVWMTKQLMWHNLEVAGLATAVELENRTQILAAQTGDMVEAARAFAEKRPPRFTGGR